MSKSPEAQSQSGNKDAMSRRDFLRHLRDFSTYTAIGAGSWVLKTQMVEPLENLTGMKVTNGGQLGDITATCSPEEPPTECVRRYFNDHFFELDILAPVIEELLFRWVPSVVFDSLSGARRRNNERLSLTKGEIAFGVASSTIFAGMHNFPSGEFDPSFLPATQFVGGMIYWALLRLRGLRAATVAHIASNVCATTFF